MGVGCVDISIRQALKLIFSLLCTDVIADIILATQFFCYGWCFWIQSYQISLEDKQKTSFITLLGTLCQILFSFFFLFEQRVATYERIMTPLFHDMVHYELEIFVGVMFAKSKQVEDHLINLDKFFGILRKFLLK